MKKLIALLFIPLLLFCGCNNESAQPRLTVEEYDETTEKAWNEYRDDGYMTLVNISVETGDDFSKMQERKDDILTACDKMDAALEKFADINPPAEYQELHDKLLKGIEDEKRWNEYRRKGFSAETEEEAEEYFDKLSEELDAMDSKETFPHIYLEIRMKLQGLEY